MSRRTSEPNVVPTLIAALAVLLSATAFSGVLGDTRWVPPALLTVVVVFGMGLAGRTLRWWPPLVVLAQLAVLLVLLIVLFSQQVFLGVVPGMAAVRELASVLSSALEVVRTGVPPVPADPAIQSLICLGLGLVGILVDTIAVTAGAPAVAGLVLLCVFAIPASLADDMLPWGAFLAGAVGFALLLMSGGRDPYWHRGLSAPRTMLGGNFAAVVGVAAVLALLTGSVFTGVGTRGRLPGDEQSASSSGAIGLRPFTSLRGQLDRDRVVDLFRVRGLPEETYLRAMTLRKFDPNRGWRLDGLAQGVNADGRLPVPAGTAVEQGTRARVEIEPVDYRDPWLPVFGVPTGITGMGTNWRYDAASGIVFTQTRQDSRPYFEEMVLPNPPSERLRTASGPVNVDPAYLDSSGAAPEIGKLAQRLTEDEPTNFDKAAALNRYFTDPANGFTYDLRTAPPQGNSALVDFLFHGKRGFCEQYASAMAVLLREIGIPSRVAVGFTSGYPEGDQQVITTNDAHAWVEAYFPGSGWITFDPTPLQDGRTSLPRYLDRQPIPGHVPPNPPENTQTTEPAPPPPPEDDPPDEALTPPPPDSGGGGWWWPAAAASVLAIAALGGAPLGLRSARRRRRFQTVTAGEPGAASAAWRELLDEFADRGTRPETTDTVRTTAAKLIDEYELDAEGAQALRELVTEVEREWYAPHGQSPAVSLREVLDTALTSLHRCAPLSGRDRILPRSVLHRSDRRVAGHVAFGWGGARR